MTPRPRRSTLFPYTTLFRSEPQFEGQTKTKLGNNEVMGVVDSTVSKALEAYLEENPREAKNIVSKVILAAQARARSEEHTSELQSQSNLVCRLLLEKKKRLT